MQKQILIDDVSILVIYHRGFVQEIRLTCEQFMQPGEACNKCHPMCPGEVYINLGPDSTWETCKACNGTGRLLSLTERIFSEHPVTRVVLTDAIAAFVDAHGIELDGKLSDEFLKHLKYESTSNWPDGRRFLTYTSDQYAAGNAISAACVAYGRALVGLPPLNNEV